MINLENFTKPKLNKVFPAEQQKSTIFHSNKDSQNEHCEMKITTIKKISSNSKVFLFLLFCYTLTLSQINISSNLPFFCMENSTQYERHSVTHFYSQQRKKN
jgi:hypothetical protein